MADLAPIHFRQALHISDSGSHWSTRPDMVDWHPLNDNVEAGAVDWQDVSTWGK